MAAESAAVEFRIDRRSGVATCLQTVQQTKQALRLGMLEPGDRLPTAREVVEATAINPNTVLKAYRELEREGLVEARRGLGTFVRRTLGGAADAAAADGPLRGDLADRARRARAAGLEKDDVGALFTAVLDTTFSTNDTYDPDDANGAETAGRSRKGGQER
ncbi:MULTISPECIES: GntR family transcriptional regulator [Streptomyces]|uniref:GntR family transcriptional regulator n=1 Tax=Streptomyces TaxID=1883 RepID=UPI0004BD172D|nr:MULTISPECIES: GntR family transcriptional regulator [Streptomyces]KOG78003.1 GntR family transcriptional regulator [Streptomyces griseus subsp. rhodochrous]KOU46258.1 GntR family transcriptional regulator [Streptomyces sp. MMG1522]